MAAYQRISIPVGRVSEYQPIRKPDKPEKLKKPNRPEKEWRHISVSAYPLAGYQEGGLRIQVGGWRLKGFVWFVWF
jgi:hypothetical protein